MTDDRSEPCSSNGGSQGQAPGGHSSKGKLLMNRSIACYPKGRNAGCAKKGAKPAEKSHQTGIQTGVNLSKHESSSDRVSDEKNSTKDVSQISEVSESYQHSSTGQDQQNEVADRSQPEVTELAKQAPPSGMDQQDTSHDETSSPCAKGQPSDLKDKAQNIHKQSNSGSSSGRQAEAQEARPHQGSQKCSQAKKKAVNLQEPQIEDDHPQVR